MQILLAQVAIGDYRQQFLHEFESVTRDRGHELAVLAGEDYFDKTTITRVDSQHLRRISNRYLFNRRLLVQPEVVGPAIKADVAVLELNPRVLSNWLIAIVRKLLGRRTVFWGHAWPRNGSNSPTDGLRHLMRLLASAIVVYTDSQSKALRSKMPSMPIFSAPNSLYSAKQISSARGQEEPTNFIYVGRLVPAKKPIALILAFAKALPLLPPSARLLVVGSGPLDLELRELAHRLGIQNEIEFHGHVSDYETLRALYSSSISSVSPGYVGLSITQSLAFGVPMLISRHEPHAPEIEAAIEGANAEFFETDNIDSLSEKLVDFSNRRVEWLSKRDSIAQDCAKRYSVERMVAGLLMAVQG